MTAPQFPQISRAASYSPKLKFSDKPNNTEASKGPRQRYFPNMQMAASSKTSVSPVKPGKRRHQAIVSPVTTRNESSSPKTKFKPPSSPVQCIITPPLVAATQFPFEDFLPKSNNGSNSVGNPFAVPKVSAEPPSPALLPSPPKHWVGEKNAQCLAQKQQCRAVTQCLVSHLALSGILVSAQ